MKREKYFSIYRKKPCLTKKVLLHRAVKTIFFSIFNKEPILGRIKHLKGYVLNDLATV